MPDIIGVQFQKTGKIYSYFPNNNEHYATGDYVIVDTSRGMKYARVMLENHFIPEEDIEEEILTVIRRATDEDAVTHQKNLQDGRDAYAVAMEKIQLCELEMKLVNVEYAFDRSRVIFNFTADERVDFRNLIKELAAVFHTRIELRQIGVRDEAKIVGGIGICGQPLCCHRYLGDFSPVSIKMAKEQNLSLNPTKISGCCGRLLCCLNYENEVYVERNRLAKEAAAAEKKACESCKCPNKDPEAVQAAETALDNAELVAVSTEDDVNNETDIIIEEAAPIEVHAAPKANRSRKPAPRKEIFENRESRRDKDNRKSSKDRRGKADYANKEKRRNERSSQREEGEQSARRPHKRGHRGGRGRNKKNEQASNNANNGQ